MQCPDVDAMLDGISEPQFNEWSAYYQIEPWGPERSDMQSAQICAVIANTAQRGRKSKRTFKITDFVLVKQPKTVEQKAELLTAFFETMKAKPISTKKKK